MKKISAKVTNNLQEGQAEPRTMGQVDTHPKEKQQYRKPL